MVGGLSKQIKEMKEVLLALLHKSDRLIDLCISQSLLPLSSFSQVIELPIKHPEIFTSLGISQPKVMAVVGEILGFQLSFSLRLTSQRSVHIDTLVLMSFRM